MIKFNLDWNVQIKSDSEIYTISCKKKKLFAFYL